MTTPMTKEEVYDSLRTNKPIYKTDDVCELLGINRTTLGLYAKYGLIKSRKLGTKYLFTFDELMDFVRQTEGMEISNTEEGIKRAAALLNAKGGRKERRLS